MSNHNSIYSQRLQHLRQDLDSKTGLLLSTPTDITYFSGFQFLVPEEREALMVITPQSATLLRASFSPFKKSDGIVDIAGCYPEALQELIVKLKKTDGLRELQIDPNSLFVNEYYHLQALPALHLTDLDRQRIWKLRTIKSSQEIKYIRQAARITKKVMKLVLAQLTVGQTELELKQLIENALTELGSQQPAFPTIVAFGAHAALPHHQPTSTKLSSNTAVLLDFGATVAGYRADMTRTIWFGDQPSAEFVQVKKLVIAAYRQVLKLLDQPKVVTAQELDHAARSLITAAGYGSKFIHTTGHGLGLDIHESLSLSWRNTQQILPHMVITIEPGIYLTGQFGYRHENTVLVTQNGGQALT